MLPALIWMGSGAVVGGVIGGFNRCPGGSCPLLSSWWRGAIYGAVMGLMFSLASKGHSASF